VVLRKAAPVIHTLKLTFLLFLFVTTVTCQNHGKLSLVHSLPDSLEEISGFSSAEGSPLLWSVNDSGNEAIVYGYNPLTNKIERTIEITNGENEDWEDVTSDDEGNIYIGDFGNNRNKRKDQVIYQLSTRHELPKVAMEAIKISFQFEDQDKFPPKKKDRNFDVEAFVYLDGNFYLFTRNRSSKFDGTTKLYKLPAQPGHHRALLMDTFVTCKDDDDCQVTAAAIDRTHNRLVLLSYNKVWLFSNYPTDNFFKGSVRKIKLNHTSQKESISFRDQTSLYIADEENGSGGRNLYILYLD